MTAFGKYWMTSADAEYHPAARVNRQMLSKTHWRKPRCLLELSEAVQAMGIV